MHILYVCIHRDRNRETASERERERERKRERERERERERDERERILQYIYIYIYIYIYFFFFFFFELHQWNLFFFQDLFLWRIWRRKRFQNKRIWKFMYCSLSWVLFYKQVSKNEWMNEWMNIILTWYLIMIMSFVIKLQVIQVIVYYFAHLKIFHTNVSWWFPSEDWVSASLLKSPGLSLVFWPVSTML